MKHTFEDFLMEKHAEQHVGTKETLVDDFNEWLGTLEPEYFIEYGDMFAKEQSKGLLEACKKALSSLKEEPNYHQLSIRMIEQAISNAESK